MQIRAAVYSIIRILWMKPAAFYVTANDICIGSYLGFEYHKHAYARTRAHIHHTHCCRRQR